MGNFSQVGSSREEPLVARNDHGLRVSLQVIERRGQRQYASPRQAICTVVGLETHDTNAVKLIEAKELSS
jgi:hypothetical protein